MQKKCNFREFFLKLDFTQLSRNCRLNSGVPGILKIVLNASLSCEKDEISGTNQHIHFTPDISLLQHLNQTLVAKNRRNCINTTYQGRRNRGGHGGAVPPPPNNLHKYAPPPRTSRHSAWACTVLTIQKRRN